MRRAAATALRRLFRILGKTALAAALAAPVWAQTELEKLYAEAQRAQASHDIPGAIRSYEAIVHLEPRMAEAHANLGNLYYQQAQTARARAEYKRAVALKPALTGPHFFLGVIAFNDHDYAAALDHLGRAAAGPSPNPLIYAYLGYARFARGEYAEAAANLESAAGLDPGNIDVLYHLSKSYGHLAENALARLHASFPGSLYPILVRAHLSEEKEDWQDTARQYNLALQKMPENARLRQKAEWSAAKAAGKTAKPPDAAPDELIDGSLAYKEAPPAGLKLQDEIARRQAQVRAFAAAANNDRQLYLEGEGYHVLAYLTSLAVIGLNEDSYRAHQLRAQMFEAANNDDGAIAEYREALKRKADLPNVHFAIGSLYWKDHRLDDARPELERELKTNPHHPQALYELGDIAAFTGHPEEAEKYFLRALNLEPGMAEAHYAIEKIYTDTGRYDQSVEHLRAALKINPSEPTAHYRLALVYRKMGRPQDAERELGLFDRSKAVAQNGSSTVR